MFSLAFILITQWHTLDFFSLCVAMMTHMADVFLGLLAPCNEPLPCVYLPCVFLLGIMSDHQFGNQFMCSVVASHVSHLPTTNLSFVWIAPPAGTGCVNFMYVFMQCQWEDNHFEIMKWSNLLALGPYVWTKESVLQSVDFNKEKEYRVLPGWKVSVHIRTLYLKVCRKEMVFCNGACHQGNNVQVHQA